MAQTFFIKNMVCNRCKMTILNLLREKGFQVESVELGKIVVNEINLPCLYT